MSLNDRLNQLMARENLTQAQVAEGLEVSRQAVQFWASGRSVPKGTNLVRLAEYFNVSVDWLTGDSSDCIEHIPGEIKSYVPGEEVPPEGFVAIPEFRLRLSAGPGAEPTWEEVNDSNEAWYPLSFFSKHGAKPSKCGRARVSGDSMEPSLYDGDFVLWVAESDSGVGCVNIIDGAIYVIGIDGQMRVKRLARTKNGIRVSSDNTQFYPSEIYENEECNRLRIFGRVLQMSRQF